MHDHLNAVLGSRRGPTRRAHLSAIITSRDSVANEEVRRLMNLAVKGQFDEPLAVMRATTGHLKVPEHGQTTLADVLNMSIATWMTEHTKSFLIPLARALGWDTFENEAAAFASGLRGRMSEILERQPTALCPPNAWREWTENLWRMNLSEILVRRLEHDPIEATRHILGMDKASMGSLRCSNTHEEWQRIVDIALSTPRPVVATAPLGPGDVMTCRQALCDELEGMVAYSSRQGERTSMSLITSW